MLNELVARHVDDFGDEVHLGRGWFHLIYCKSIIIIFKFKFV